MGREEEGRLRPVAKKDPGLRSPSLQYTNYAFPEKVFLFPFFPRAELVALSSHFLTLSSAALMVHHTDGVALHVGRRACKLWAHLATKTPPPLPPTPSELKRGKVLREESTRQGGRRSGEILAAKLEKNQNIFSESCVLALCLWIDWRPEIGMAFLAILVLPFPPN